MQDARESVQTTNNTTKNELVRARVQLQCFGEKNFFTRPALY